MVFRDPDIAPFTGREDGTSLVGGDEGLPILQSDGKFVIRTGATSEVADYDVINHDLVNDGDYSIADGGQADIGGTQELSGALKSEGGGAFNVKIRWLNEDGELLYEEAPSGLTNVADAIIETITVKGDKCDIVVTDNSSLSTNVINGTFNFH